MTIRETYRHVALGLTVVFALFNIGLPVVIASCPMTSDEGSAACFGCFEESTPGTHQISYQKDTSCCATILAVERRSAEFVHVEKLLCRTQDVALTVLPLEVAISQTITTASSSHLYDLPPPSPGTEDIPILLSVLLI